MRVFNDITKTIGQTPLVKMQRLDVGLRANILLKLEFFNPLASVKDRIGLAMIEAAELNGLLKPGGHIIEPTSGNTGIAIAYVAAAKGYRVTLTMPEGMSMERRTLLLCLGANLVLTPAASGMRGAISKAKELLTKTPNSIMLSQFDNPANPAIHEETTALEIWHDTDGTVDAVIAGVGTGGTFTGVGRTLKKKKKNLKMIAVEPSESPVISGGAPGPHKIQGIGGGFIPENFDRTLLDHVEKISSEDALITARKLIREEGIPVGISGGAAVAAALKIGAMPEFANKTIVVIIPSTTERYLSTVLAESERKRALELPVENLSQIS